MHSALKAKFRRHFAKEAHWIFSAPGRTELGGNHTDHQHGCVLAAAVDLDIRAAVKSNSENCIRLYSEGHPPCMITLPAGDPRENEIGTTAALVRGIAARFAALGYSVSGFDAYVLSDVQPGSGLSSSAAFEVLIALIINELNQCGLRPVELAQIGQYAENVYFGKPCGLMDQMASALGNVIAIDFADPASPVVERIDLDLTAYGHTLCIIDTGANHADLTDAFAAIPGELAEVCACFGAKYLREVSESEFYAALPRVRAAAGDRAVLRAMHVFEENRRVGMQIDALKRGDFSGFLQLVNASGRSSWRYLQNVIPEGRTTAQEVAVALALAERLLDGRGACRVHGGGFAGTIQAFVPDDLSAKFCSEMDAVFGSGSCRVLHIRPWGGMLSETIQQEVTL